MLHGLSLEAVLGSWLWPHRVLVLDEVRSLQTLSCGSDFIRLDGSKRAALARWIILTIFASRAR